MKMNRILFGVILIVVFINDVNGKNNKAVSYLIGKKFVSVIYTEIVSFEVEFKNDSICSIKYEFSDPYLSDSIRNLNSDFKYLSKLKKNKDFSYVYIEVSPLNNSNINDTPIKISGNDYYRLNYYMPLSIDNPWLYPDGSVSNIARFNPQMNHYRSNNFNYVKSFPYIINRHSSFVIMFPLWNDYPLTQNLFLMFKDDNSINVPICPGLSYLPTDSSTEINTYSVNNNDTNHLVGRTFIHTDVVNEKLIFKDDSTCLYIIYLKNDTDSICIYSECTYSLNNEILVLNNRKDTLKYGFRYLNDSENEILSNQKLCISNINYDTLCYDVNKIHWYVNNITTDEFFFVNDVIYYCKVYSSSEFQTICKKYFFIEDTQTNLVPINRIILPINY